MHYKQSLSQVRVPCHQVHHSKLARRPQNSQLTSFIQLEHDVLEILKVHAAFCCHQLGPPSLALKLLAHLSRHILHAACLEIKHTNNIVHIMLLIIHTALQPISCAVQTLPLCQCSQQYLSRLEGAKRGPNSAIFFDLVGKQHCGAVASDSTAHQDFPTARLSHFLVQAAIY